MRGRVWYEQEEGLGVLVAGPRNESGRHNVCLTEELLRMAGEPGHFEEDLRTTGGETHSCDIVRVSTKVGD